MTRVHHLLGSANAESAEQLLAILTVRTPAGGNDFWLDAGDPYPHLAVTIEREFACVHYFPRRGHPGFQSVNRERRADHGYVPLHGTVQIEVPRSSLVSIEAAYQAALEFATDPAQPPPSLEWYEF